MGISRIYLKKTVRNILNPDPHHYAFITLLTIKVSHSPRANARKCTFFCHQSKQDEFGLNLYRSFLDVFKA